jgi:hypothetical protein
MHALLACAAAEIPVNNLQYRRMAGVHYIKAVASLRQSLVQTGDSSQWTVVLWTVLMLCIYEVSRRSNGLINPNNHSDPNHITRKASMSISPGQPN